MVRREKEDRAKKRTSVRVHVPDVTAVCHDDSGILRAWTVSTHRATDPVCQEVVVVVTMSSGCE